MLDSSASPSEAGAATDAATVKREVGHPFFNAASEAVLFLSGGKRAPVVHVDPECAVLNKDLADRKRRELPVGPVTIDEIESQLGYKEKAKCCPACKTPPWIDHERYADVRGRFRKGPSSADLPARFVQSNT